MFPATTAAESAAMPTLADVDQEVVGAVTCSICLAPCSDAVRACSADHYNCASCLRTLVDQLPRSERALARCPMCRDPVVFGRNGRPGISAPLVNAVINTQRCECPAEGCNEVVRVADLRAHSKVCPKTKVPCPYARLGCEGIHDRDQLEAHMKSEWASHLKLTVQRLDTVVAAVDTTSGHVRTNKRLLDRVQGEQRRHRASCEQSFSAIVDKVNGLADSLSTLTSIVRAQAEFATHTGREGPHRRRLVAKLSEADAPRTPPPTRPVCPGAPRRGPDHGEAWLFDDDAVGDEDSDYEDHTRPLPPPPPPNGPPSPQYTPPSSPPHEPVSPTYAPTSPAYDPAEPPYDDDYAYEQQLEEALDDSAVAPELLHGLRG